MRNFIFYIIIFLPMFILHGLSSFAMDRGKSSPKNLNFSQAYNQTPFESPTKAQRECQYIYHDQKMSGLMLGNNNKSREAEISKFQNIKRIQIDGNNHTKKSHHFLDSPSEKLFFLSPNKKMPSQIHFSQVTESHLSIVSEGQDVMMMLKQINERMAEQEKRNQQQDKEIENLKSQLKDRDQFINVLSSKYDTLENNMHTLSNNFDSSCQKIESLEKALNLQKEQHTIAQTTTNGKIAALNITVKDLKKEQCKQRYYTAKALRLMCEEMGISMTKTKSKYYMCNADQGNTLSEKQKNTFTIDKGLEFFENKKSSNQFLKTILIQNLIENKSTFPFLEEIKSNKYEYNTLLQDVKQQINNMGVQSEEKENYSTLSKLLQLGKEAYDDFLVALNTDATSIGNKECEVRLLSSNLQLLGCPKHKKRRFLRYFNQKIKTK